MPSPIRPDGRHMKCPCQQRSVQRKLSSVENSFRGSAAAAAPFVMLTAAAVVLVYLALFSLCLPVVGWWIGADNVVEEYGQATWRAMLTERAA